MTRRAEFRTDARWVAAPAARPAARRPLGGRRESRGACLPSPSCARHGPICGVDAGAATPGNPPGDTASATRLARLAAFVGRKSVAKFPPTSRCAGRSSARTVAARDNAFPIGRGNLCGLRRSPQRAARRVAVIQSIPSSRGRGTPVEVTSAAGVTSCLTTGGLPTFALRWRVPAQSPPIDVGHLAGAAPGLRGWAGPRLG